MGLQIDTHKILMDRTMVLQSPAIIDYIQRNK